MKATYTRQDYKNLLEPAKLTQAGAEILFNIGVVIDSPALPDAI